MKIKKRKKSSRMHGRKMGTHGGGCRKNRKGSGHRGGKGMAGSGKRGDQKKTLVNKRHGHGYFGKKGVTSLHSYRDKRDRINLAQIESNLESFVVKGLAKKSGEGYEINLKSYKILGTGEVKNSFIIEAESASKSAVEKVSAAGGKINIKFKEEKSSEKKEFLEKSESD